ncbi:sigma-70 family RNA polymerase sigma factor [Microbispora sp. ZYX-F-249]|uniref:RNA polymerase sigma factor n=1 Tax=Microbispora maris TaxID=3144104 RepID=A0ABV0AZU6_9ACTN
MDERGYIPGAFDPGLLETYMARIGRTPLLTARQEVELARRIEAGVYARHLLDENPGRPEAAELEILAGDGLRARDHLIRANLRLVVSMARRYLHRGASLSDIIQDGNLGLIEAVDRFDHRRGFRFSTCAAWWIRKAIQKGQETSGPIRIPGHVRDELHRLARAEEKLVGETGYEPTAERLAEELGRPVERVLAWRLLARNCVSLDARPPLNQSPQHEPVEHATGARPEAALEQAALTDALRSARAALAPRQALIVRLRFGLDGTPEQTRRQTAETVGVPHQWMSRLEREALTRMRDHDGGRTLAAWAG